MSAGMQEIYINHLTLHIEHDSDNTKESIISIHTLLSSTCAEVVGPTLAPSWQGALNSHEFETVPHPVKLSIVS